LTSLPFCEYGGFAFISQDFVNMEFIDGKKTLIKQHPMSLGNPEAIWLSENFMYNETNLQTLLLNLKNKSEEELYISFRKSTRQSIEKGYIEEDLLVRKAETQWEKREFYKLYVETMKRHKSLALPFRYFDELLLLSDADLWVCFKKIKISECVSQAEMVAGILILKHKDVAFYHVSANKGDKSCANHCLLWRAIGEAKREGMKWFDFGATEPNSKNFIFKSGFRGKVAAIRNYANFDYREIAQDSWKRKLWHKCPEWVHSLLSDWIWRKVI
jgi:lipid II:glycine glycyltransferase (peptidoglycan interpeptide bridge formation enzyme)